MTLDRTQKIIAATAGVVGIGWIFVQHQRGKKKSRAGEQCRTSADCAADLGCFDSVCGPRSSGA